MPPANSSTPPAAPRSRVRLPPAERRRQIVEAATRLVGEQGFYGMSLKDVADAVGLTQPGLLHYVHTKEGLLQLLVEQAYDQRFDPEDYVATGDPAATHPDGASLPGYFRYLVANNARDPQLIKLYMVLGAESSSPEHPAHEYFRQRPDAAWGLYSATRWRVPPSTGGFSSLRPLVEMTLASMDGLQVRLFRDPPIDLVTEWARYEQVLFPSPVWDGYR
ncbi:TetR/AcrR family transcriptional regulator [Serinibacter arcticus]|uniref:TetR/AcrR family transcriptional regulator n=1 Tax=Serinibacter arcticus TaxID=1655435 RepID=A0A2U1ZXF5_9MICO|nr:TetR/AcrR family transcriptional regulator [Serinibacter arcticus]PWD51668.1 TetR/AcrR family transcriptional regulator [Serinibacter arcticus]